MNINNIKLQIHGILSHFNLLRFKESRLAHKYLDGLKGIEIGGSAHNSFGLNTLNVDIEDSNETIYKKEEQKMCGKTLAVDIVAPGDQLPLPDESVDFVINSHVLEHFYDPINALKEWYRVVKKGGYIFMIIPHKERTFDKDKPRTTLSDLIERHDLQAAQNDLGLSKTYNDPKKNGMHFSVWITEDVVELINYLGWHITAVRDVDDKVGNGFAIVVRKEN